MTYSSFALVKLDGRLRKMTLPIVIGNDDRANIILNSRRYSEKPKVVTERSGKLLVVDPESGKTSTPKYLEAYGLRVAGPIPGEPNSDSFKSRMLAWAHMEPLFMGSLAPWAKKLLLLDRPLRIRWLVRAGSIVGLSLLGLIWSGHKQELQDLSGQVRPIPFGKILNSKLGATAQFPQYLKGMTLGFQLPAGVSSDIHLGFKLARIELDREVHISVNGHQIFESRLMNQCPEAECPYAVRVNKTFLKTGQNLLRIRHNPSSPDYILSQLTLSALAPLELADRARTERLLALAQRNYDERGISYQNIINAKNQLGQLAKIVATRETPEELNARYEILKADIEGAFDKVSKQLLQEIEIDMNLQLYTEARSKLNDLLRMYPNPAHQMNQVARVQIEKLKSRP